MLTLASLSFAPPSSQGDEILGFIHPEEDRRKIHSTRVHMLCDTSKKKKLQKTVWLNCKKLELALNKLKDAPWWSTRDRTTLNA